MLLERGAKFLFMKGGGNSLPVAVALFRFLPLLDALFGFRPHLRKGGTTVPSASNSLSLKLYREIVEKSDERIMTIFHSKK